MRQAVPSKADKSPSHCGLKSAIPTALSEFDKLPDSAQVDARTVAGLFSCGVATVWRRAAKGLLPRPRKFGVSARWNVGELRAVLAGSPAEAQQ